MRLIIRFLLRKEKSEKESEMKGLDEKAALAVEVLSLWEQEGC